MGSLVSVNTRWGRSSYPGRTTVLFESRLNLDRLDSTTYCLAMKWKLDNSDKTPLCDLYIYMSGKEDEREGGRLAMVLIRYETTNLAQ